VIKLFTQKSHGNRKTLMSAIKGIYIKLIDEKFL